MKSKTTDKSAMAKRAEAACLGCIAFKSLKASNSFDKIITPMGVTGNLCCSCVVHTMFVHEAKDTGLGVRLKILAGFYCTCSLKMTPRLQYEAHKPLFNDGL